MVVVNGVFEGGGAKGLLYVGALQACEAAGVEFGAVAGSSAGAITAMLVASGYSAEAVEKKMESALKTLGRPLVAVVTPGRRSLLASKKLRSWLAEALAEQIYPERPVEQARTFADVREATKSETRPQGTSLYVVTMDLASGQPLVFSPDLTPNMSVADAVVASSAIPVAFPSQRVEIDKSVRRLVDGGVWANYPAFVFLDDDFRDQHGPLDDGADDHDTVGFLLGSVDAGPLAGRDSSIIVRPPRPWSTDLGAAERELGAVGGLVTSPFARLAAILLPFVILVLGVSWFEREVDEELPLIGKLPDGLQDIALLLLVLAFALLVVQSTLFAFLTVRMGRAMVDEGLVGASAAMGVGPNVPYWVGPGKQHSDDGRRHLAVRLTVPDKLTTLKSRPKPELQTRAIESGRYESYRALAGFLELDRPAPWSPPPKDEPVATGPVTKRQRAKPFLSGLLFWVGFFVVSALAFDVLKATVEDRVPWWQLTLIFLVGVGLLVLHGWQRTRSATGPPTWLRRQPSGVLVVFTIVMGLLGLIFVGVTFTDEGELSIRERMKAPGIPGVVLKVDALEGAFDDDNLVTVRLDRPLPEYREADDEDPTTYVDNEGDDLEWCDPEQVCLEMPTDHEFAEGQDVEVFHGEGVAFLEEDRWSFPGFAALFPVLAVWLLVLSYAAWRALRWRRDNPQPEPDAPLPPPAPGEQVVAQS